MGDKRLACPLNLQPASLQASWLFLRPLRWNIIPTIGSADTSPASCFSFLVSCAR